MPNLTTLKNRLALDFKRTNLTAQIANAIGDAVTHYQGQRFAFNQLRASFYTTAGREFYACTGTPLPPADIAEVDSITIDVNGRQMQLKPMSFDLGERINTTTNSQSQPQAWSWYAQQIRLYPVPDAVYTMTIAYLQKLPVPASDGASNAWTTEAEALIRYFAQKTIYRDTLLRPDLGAAAEIAEQAAYRRLKRESFQLDTGGLAASGI